MTYGELKLRTLQLMFSNETAALTADDNNQEYLNALPGVANAGMSVVCSVGAAMHGTFQIILSASATESSSAAGSLTLPVAEVWYKVKLADYCQDFRAIDPGEVYLERNGYGPSQDWTQEGDGIFVIRGDEAGTWTLRYFAYPAEVAFDTADATELGIPRECAELLPLYIAGELYKDDDLAMAVQLRNEFEDGLLKLQSLTARRGSGGSYQNKSGWW